MALQATVQDLESEITWSISVGPGATIRDVIESVQQQSHLRIVDLIHHGRLLKQDWLLANIRGPWQFCACVWKAGDDDEPPLAVRPISQNDIDHLTEAFEGPLLATIRPHLLQELHLLMPKGLDDVTLIHFYHYLNDDMERVRTVANNIKAKIH
jgi:hypothetical protein